MAAHALRRGGSGLLCFFNGLRKCVCPLRAGSSALRKGSGRLLRGDGALQDSSGLQPGKGLTGVMRNCPPVMPGQTGPATPWVGRFCIAGRLYMYASLSSVLCNYGFAVF
jgi:hypothetical protein